MLAPQISLAGNDNVVAITQALYSQPDALLMDVPVSTLAEKNIGVVESLMQDAAAKSAVVAYCSHR